MIRGGVFYIHRSDKPGTRGPLGERDAHRALEIWQKDAPHDATLEIQRDDGSIFKRYRYTIGDDGYAAWHLQDAE